MDDIGPTGHGDHTGNGGYEAEIAITEAGVVHVTAGNWGSLGFGQGWGCARDNLGVIADQIIKARGERALHWGRGVNDTHLASDLGYRMLDLVGRAPALRDAQPSWIRELVDGYTAGYNLAVRDRSSGPGPLVCGQALGP